MKTVGIIGTGLIGGSIGMRAQALGHRVIGYDVDLKAAKEAVACGAIDEAVTRSEVDEQADVVVIAAHIGGTLEELARLRSAVLERALLVIDISSVKAPIVSAARGVRNFVATHPMAGAERSGAGAARPGLFEGKTWLYVPAGDAGLDTRAAEFIASMGALPVPIDAEEHDRVVALTSHLPQVFATVFTARLEGSAVDASTGCGPVAQTLLRIGHSGNAMWADIVDANRSQLCAELRAVAHDLLRVAEGLENGSNIYRQPAER